MSEPITPPATGTLGVGPGMTRPGAPAPMRRYARTGSAGIGGVVAGGVSLMIGRRMADLVTRARVRR